MVISSVCILVLILNNEVLKPRLAKRCSFPVPIQLIVVVVATGVSYGVDFEDKWNVKIVGELPTG